MVMVAGSLPLVMAACSPLLVVMEVWSSLRVKLDVRFSLLVVYLLHCIVLLLIHTHTHRFYSPLNLLNNGF